MSGGQMQDLEKVVRSLQAIEDIKKLQAKYSYLVDSFKLDALMDLFVDDATANFIGSDLIGKAQIQTFFRDVVMAAAVMLRHLNTNPIIEVDGDTAVGEWYCFGPGAMKTPNGQAATWFMGKYTNQYVNVKGQWKFKKVVFETTFSVSYKEGWVKAQAAK
jgi:ketosteroid isomerase-like protein